MTIKYCNCMTGLTRPPGAVLPNGFRLLPNSEQSRTLETAEHWKCQRPRSDWVRVHPASPVVIVAVLRWSRGSTSFKPKWGLCGGYASPRFCARVLDDSCRLPSF